MFWFFGLEVCGIIAPNQGPNLQPLNRWMPGKALHLLNCWMPGKALHSLNR